MNKRLYAVLVGMFMAILPIYSQIPLDNLQLDRVYNNPVATNKVLNQLNGGQFGQFGNSSQQMESTMPMQGNNGEGNLTNMKPTQSETIQFKQSSSIPVVLKSSQYEPDVQYELDLDELCKNMEEDANPVKEIVYLGKIEPASSDLSPKKNNERPNERLKEEITRQKVGLPSTLVTNAMTYTQDDPNNLNRNAEDNLKKFRERLLLLCKQQQGATKIFGHSVFQQPKSYYPQLFNVPVNSDYILGPGDQLEINIWGKIEQNFRAVVNQDGNIFIPKVGKISLLGVRFGAVNQLLQARLSEYYVNFNVSVSLSELRAITVYVLGDVKKPGAYQVPAMSTAFNALYSAGGPTSIGSLRSVDLIRNNRVIATLDLYHYLIKGLKSQDPVLQNNDTVLVNPIRNTITIEGLINRPGIYEIQPNDTLYSAVENAGGLKVGAYQKRIQIKRVKNGINTTVQDIVFNQAASMAAEMKKVKLSKGDVVIILQITDQVRNYVEITGNVYKPGQYAFFKGMTTQDLIDLAEGPMPGTYKKRLEINRYVSKDYYELIPSDISTPEGQKFKLQEWDKVRVFAEQDVFAPSYVYIEGAVETPGKYKLMKEMKVLDVLFHAKIDPNADLKRVELYRTGSTSDDQKIIQLNLSQLFKNPATPDNLLLQSEDRLYLRVENNVASANSVTLSGEVRFPGKYVIRQNERVSSLIERAGGFTENAFLKGSIFTRQSVVEREVVGQLKFAQEEQKRMIYDQTRINSLTGTGPTLIQSQEKALKFLEEQASKSSGRIVLNLTPYDKFSGSRDDVVLENGDKLYIPSVPASVQVVGGVNNPGAILYAPGQKYKYYVDQTGGYTEFAKRDKLYILKANGSISRELSAVQVGDVIYVPETVKTSMDFLDITSKLATILGNIALVIKVFN